MASDDIEHRITVVETLLTEREKQAARDRAEYERRLDSLNHAHAEAQRVLGTYLPRETWEQWLKEEQKRRELIDADVSSLREQASNAAAKLAGSAAANRLNLAVATLVLGVIVLIANGRIG